MSRSSNESTSSASESDVNVGVQSALNAIKAAMKCTLAINAIVLHHCDKATRTQMLDILDRYKMMCKGVFWVRPKKLTFLDYWVCFGAHALESFAKLEGAYKTMLDNMEKLESVKKHYGKKKTQQKVRRTCFSHGRSKKMKVESNACLKASKKKLSHLNL